MEKLWNMPIVWVSFLILSIIFFSKGWIARSLSQMYSSGVIIVTSIGFLLLSLNLHAYGFTALTLATALTGFACKCSDFIRDERSTNSVSKRK